MHPKKFAKHLHHDSVVAAIHDAEHKTTGKILVSISPRHVDDPVATAQAEFLRLGMNKSPERNGVLIFIAPRAHKFAVIGDEGVHKKCGDEFWRELADAMSGYFRKSEFTPGIIHGVQKAGEQLAAHFPKNKSA
ncbi:MAG TPA: TPM domain-containing protein [Candidatus Aquilonibacter sp.]|nr:TPM domain-containing protein [Candidatus Aquilonibacter sp.]